MPEPSTATVLPLASSAPRCDGGIHPAGKSADHHQLALRQVVGQPVRYGAAVGAGPPRSHHRHRILREDLRVAPHIEQQWRVGNLLEQRGIFLAVEGDQLAVGFG